MKKLINRKDMPKGWRSFISNLSKIECEDLCEKLDDMPMDYKIIKLKSGKYSIYLSDEDWGYMKYEY